MRNNSILDKNVRELLNIDIDYVRNSLISELNELSFLCEEERNTRIKNILVNLFLIKPNSDRIGRIYYSEHRLFVDLISIPEFYNNSYIRDYLNNVSEDFLRIFYDMDDKINLLKRIFNLYDNEVEKIDKFNYVFRSSVVIGMSLLDDESGFKFELLCTLMNYFDKEDLSQIVKFLFNNNDLLEQLSNYEYLEKKLFLISVMNKKMKLMLGSSNNFLYNLYECSNGMFDSILCDFYDKLVGSKDNEERFLNDVLNDRCENLNSLIESIISHDFLSRRFHNVSNYEDFMKERNLLRREYHNWILDLGKFESSCFDKDRDFRVVENNDDLDKFKEAFLYNVFGMKMKDVSKIVNFYGNYLKDTFDDVDDSEREIFFILKALSDIDKLSFRDKGCQEKIRFLQLQYYVYLEKYGLYNRNNIYSSIVLDSLFSKMFINTYNKRLFDVDKCNVLFSDDGVDVIDASDKFCMILTSFCGSYGRYYDENINMASKWNTAFNSNNQGISCSCITNENLGVFSLAEPMIGFGYIPEYALNTMGISDIYTNSNNFNLRSGYIGDSAYKRFVPGSIIDDETRYGYNEFLIDRFLMDDEDNVLKLQPSYVIFYKVNDDYKNTRLYKSSLKLAKDFKIPIVMIDVYKVKEKEQEEIQALEDDLFNGNNPNKMREILVRYMNNYTGSLVLSTHSDISYGKDFSIVGMDNFFNRVIDKINSINDINLKKAWVKALEDCYILEKNKYVYARGVRQYHHSVIGFILEKYDLENRIHELKNDLIGKKKGIKSESVLVNVRGRIVTCDEVKYFTDDDYKNKVIKVKMPNGKHMVYLRKNDYVGEVEAIVGLTKMLGLGTDFQEFYHNGGILDSNLIRGIYNNNESSSKIENLVMSYFFECDDEIIDDLISSDFRKKPSFKCTDSFNIKVSEELLDKLNLAIDRIEEIPNDEFLKIFGVVIEKYSKSVDKSFETVACSLLDKKNNMRNIFNSCKSIKVKK